MAIERLNQIPEKKDRELASLLQNLIKIPSYVETGEDGTEYNENSIVSYMENWLKSNTNLAVHKQTLEGGRYNLIASKGKPEIVFLGHTDTVAPSFGGQYDQLAAEIHDGKIWGRGSADMKSGIASIMQALSLSPDADNVWAMFYADEEYDFLGMKGLIKEYSDIRPKFLISADGGNLEIGHGCRGLIEFRARVRGVSGHPAVGNGVNAIDGVFAGITDLRQFLNDYKHPVMGGTSFNLAYLLGGLKKEDSMQEGRLKIVGQEGNVIPDVAEFVVDIRPSSPDLTVDKIVAKLESGIKESGCVVEDLKVRHNLGAWFTDLSDVKEFVEIAQQATGQKEIGIVKPGEGGYLDLQMLWEATGRPKSVMFGGGEKLTEHMPDEHIKIDALIKERDFFKKVLEKYAK